jgi:hypothetical protein
MRRQYRRKNGLLVQGNEHTSRMEKIAAVAGNHDHRGPRRRPFLNLLTLAEKAAEERLPCPEK